jgi:hypothetical protein
LGAKQVISMSFDLWVEFVGISKENQTLFLDPNQAFGLVAIDMLAHC